ncbi:MAG: Crp/Fnr family transcriptional regulator [Peptoniphilus sp.]|nr:Crp/Fnr family transcriptional regulator [Peptoniphilus sp.]MDD7362850.1 Crp/Fnr family transcriptional regulator [Bacillota bacterium]MDY6043958.1 Crp/Fnr family transcriptional regulator [Peptoniphilus sp.]
MACKDCRNHGNCLSKIEIFKNLSPEESGELYKTAIHKDVEKNEEIFREGEPIDKIIIIRYGKMKSASYDLDGREYIRDIYTAGDTIGEDSIFVKSKFETGGITLEKTGICIISLASIKRLIFENPDFSIKMIENLSKKLYQSKNLVEILSIKDAYKKLGAFLLYRSKMIGKPLVELNQENIASSLSLSRETVSRKLSELEADGYIETLAYRRIQIVDKEGLRDIVKE